MQVSLNEFLQLIKVIRMLYGLDVAKELFEYGYKQFGFTFEIKDDILFITSETHQKKGK